MKSKLNILLADDLHINVKNFASFYKFMEKQGATVKNINTRRAWITVYGHYEPMASVRERARLLAKLGADELYNYQVKGVNLFNVARAEVMARVVAQPEWHGAQYPHTSRGMFDQLMEQNKQVLLLGLAAAWDWLDFWTQALADEKQFTHACIFSGSLIYQRTLIELLRFTPTKVIVMETFFTGNDYYCEEKYEPISNNTNLKHKTVFESLAGDESESLVDRERIKAINKVLTMNNKNVQQPDTGEPLEFVDEAKIITIFGQVLNDFSLLEYRAIGLCSIAIYKELIHELASSGFNVVFKAHPWEEKKTNIGRPLTRDSIRNYIATLPEVLQQRVQVVDHYPIDKLFALSHAVAGLNSQSLIEAAFYGFKPIQFGDAFFGNKGFTYDVTPAQISEIVISLQQGSLSGTLSLTEYRCFEDFLVTALQRFLVSCHDSGLVRLAQVFEMPASIQLLSNKAAKDQVQPTPVNTTSASRPAARLATAPANSQKDKSLVTGASDPSPLDRKLHKLRRNPRKFFADSNNGLVRIFRHLF
jgi:Capsule polysaccharide biosynthesis protein